MDCGEGRARREPRLHGRRRDAAPSMGERREHKKSGRKVRRVGGRKNEREEARERETYFLE
jgi:hypothetical protein